MEVDQKTNEWLRVADLRPQLRKHVDIYTQVYRGNRWYVLHDTANGHHLRVNESAHAFIARLDGDLPVQDIWEILVGESAELAPDKEEIILILTQLFAIDLLRSNIPIDAKEFFNRYLSAKNLHKRRALMNPLALRFALFDPDSLLNHLMIFLRPLFSWSGFIIWSVIVSFACLLAMINFPILQAAVSPEILAPKNILLMLVLYCMIKLIHEFAHGLAVKIWGGEVHEMGITLLVLMPIPHVDASAASAFRNKYKRMFVGAAGIFAELLMAALALIVWFQAEPGLLKDAALNIVLIGSVSTLLFNANPLLRFDGYYVFQDLIEIPNLYTRSSKYYLYLIQRYLFKLDQITTPQTAKGERAWFLLYGLAATLYRLVIIVSIALFLAEQYLFIGVALAVWAIINQLLIPLIRGLRFLLSAPVLTQHRIRAGLVTSGLIGSFVLILVYVPVSLSTRANGIVWLSDQAQVFVETSGFVDEILVQSGESVSVGEPILRMHAPLLDTRIEVLEAKRRELELRNAAEKITERVQSKITMEELNSLESELRLLQERSSSLLLLSRISGKIVIPDEKTLKGLYLKQGDLLAYIIRPEDLIVRTVIPQQSIGLVQKQVSNIQVQFAEQLGKTVNARILRETPAGNTMLPSAALGAAGGGGITVSMSDSSGRTATEKLFQLDLSIPAELNLVGLGARDDLQEVLGRVS